jgi:hypothetical protein
MKSSSARLDRPLQAQKQNIGDDGMTNQAAIIMDG